MWLVPRHLRPSIQHELETGLAALAEGHPKHFITRLPPPQYWRIAAAFPHDTIFLDIETTGLSRYYHQLTLIGWATGGRFNAYISGGDQQALDELQSDLNRASALVTFNGAHFDLPFLRMHAPNLCYPAAHIDLRHLSHRTGSKGGQKRIELELGISRNMELKALTSGDAPGLWYRYQRGDLDALSLLLRYNHADVEGLRLVLAALVTKAEPDLPLEWQPTSVKLTTGKKLAHDNERFTIAVRPYTGESGPRLKLSDLPTVKRLSVVGIDLSGGPRRGTGWAFVRGHDATTMTLHDDDEIINATLQAKPDLVSIDAPLSLPVGRNYAEDTDPARQQFGITRECERILRRRGVNVYPCLIRSMQSLTVRGIRLAQRLRVNGIPVIESFPGAMQDILGMPRKRVSLELLKQAIAEYGLEGKFLHETITHDELDALSSAIVGQFFWEGRYEALGTEAEDYLIIPSLSELVQIPKLVVGISGYTGSGKTTIAEILSDTGFAVISFSDVLASLFPRADSRALERQELQLLGEQVHNNPGQRWLGQQVMKRVLEHNSAVIDGLRFPEDHAFFVERLGPHFLHLQVTASADLRKERFLRRGGTSEAYMKAVMSTTESHIHSLQALAHRAIDNDGQLEQVRSSVSTALNQLTGGD
jgi:predicted nuclease with RNAse H fold/dephospho-CoA kinase